MTARMPTVSEMVSEPGNLATSGEQKLEWARRFMPILAKLRSQLTSDQPFANERIAMAMHVEATTGVFVETLRDAGADIALTGCNPLSTHDDVSVALDAQEGIDSFAKRGVDDEGYYDAIDAVLDFEPTITVDDGADLIFRLHESRREALETVIGGCEETTTGVKRLRHMAADDALEYPVFAVNDTPMKRLFDNIHGTGESSLASIALTTNLAWAGKTVVVAGFGHCGKGLARKAAGQNAHVIVTEVDPRRALEAHMEGFEVRQMADAAPDAEVVITATGNRDVLTPAHFEQLPDGAVLANAGHFDIEIDIDGLQAMAANSYAGREGVTVYELPDGRRINVLAEGRLVNLATPIAQGHPIEVMDQSFGIQTVGVRELVKNAPAYDAGVHDVPDELDREIAEIKLAAEDVHIDSLTEAQTDYLQSWQHGT